MTLSHAIEQIPNHSNVALDTLNSTIKAKIQQAQKGGAFQDIEKELHIAFIEAESLVMSEMLAQYDINLSAVMVDGIEYRQVFRGKQTYTCVAGNVSVERSLYRQRSGALSICPLELRAGIVEKHWSSNAAKQALLVVSKLTPYEAAHLFKELGAMQPSKSSLDRLPKKLGRQWGNGRDEFELSMRHEFKIPEEALTLAASLDGVLVPMQGNVVIPGDSRYEEASCGALTYYNEAGDPLITRRYSCMPEHKKVTLKAFIEKEVNYAIHCRPDLQLVKVADGAKDNWTFLDGVLPKGKSVLDFYHAAEHLKKAFDVAYGIKSLESDAAFAQYRSILRHDKTGIDKIIRHLGYLLKKIQEKMD